MYMICICVHTHTYLLLYLCFSITGAYPDTDHSDKEWTAEPAKGKITCCPKFYGRLRCPYHDLELGVTGQALRLASTDGHAKMHIGSSEIPKSVLLWRSSCHKLHRP